MAPYHENIIDDLTPPHLKPASKKAQKARKKPKAKAKPFVMGDTGVTVRNGYVPPVATRAMKRAAGPPKGKPPPRAGRVREIERETKLKRATPAESAPQFTQAQLDKARMKAWKAYMRIRKIRDGLVYFPD